MNYKMIRTMLERLSTRQLEKLRDELDSMIRERGS